MKIENTEVYFFRAALRAMRNPRESWDKSDSKFGEESVHFLQRPWPESVMAKEFPFIGENDLKLADSLVKSGSEHRKFLRQIIIQAELTLPRYVWQEWDTYKVSTVRNSCSTMHKLGHRSLTEEDFQDGEVSQRVLEDLNDAGTCYRTKSVLKCGELYEGYNIVRWMKRHLPEAFLQMAAVTLSYETALSMLRQRRSHRLPEWSGAGSICEWLRSLPYLKRWEEVA